MSLDNFKKQTITWDMINQAFEQPIQIMEILEFYSNRQPPKCQELRQALLPYRPR